MIIRILIIAFICSCGQSVWPSECKIYVHNIKRDNVSFTENLKKSSFVESEILFFSEASNINLSKIQQVLSAHKRLVSIREDERNYGLEIWSKRDYPYQIIEIREVPVAVILSINTVSVVLLHLPPPIFIDLIEIRTASLDAILKALNPREQILIAGDFNAPAWTPSIARLRMNLKLAWPDDYWSHGTWPTILPIFSIDFALSNFVMKNEYGPNFDSDHKSMCIKW